MTVTVLQNLVLEAYDHLVAAERALIEQGNAGQCATHWNKFIATMRDLNGTTAAMQETKPRAVR
ncbi:MAG TPA: hypothetical protein VLA36_11845 [Longimicrobiales bacterium]|nr:hypothetical protein [Longimicrobiales bacterium]